MIVSGVVGHTLFFQFLLFLTQKLKQDMCYIVLVALTIPDVCMYSVHGTRMNAAFFGEINVQVKEQSHYIYNTIIIGNDTSS